MKEFDVPILGGHQAGVSDGKLECIAAKWEQECSGLLASVYTVYRHDTDEVSRVGVEHLGDGILLGAPNHFPD
jgi:hypothetical protein